MKIFVLTGLIAILGSVNVDGYTRHVPHYHRWGYQHNHGAPKEWPRNQTFPGQSNLLVMPPQYQPNLSPVPPQLPPYSIPRPPQFPPNWQLTSPHLPPFLPPDLPQYKPNIPAESSQFQPNLPIDRPQFQPDLPGPPQFQPDWPPGPDFQSHIPAEQPQFQPNLPFRPPQYNPQLHPGLPNFNSNLPPGPLPFQSNLPAGIPQSHAHRPPRPPHYQSNWPHRPPSRISDWPSQIILLPTKPHVPWNPNAPKPNRPSDWKCGTWGCHPPNNGYDGQQPIYPTPIKPAKIQPTSDAESTTVPTEQCVFKCPFTPEYNPVCGTNDVTYTNIGFLKCAQSCGVNVTVKCEKSCNDCNLEINVTSDSVTNTSATVKNCMDTCKTSQEYLPVCGTNNVTYDNIDKLLCAKNCGLNVELQQRSACNTPVSNAKPISYKTLASFEQCMKGCPMNINIDQVCGTNNETYLNIDRLNCAKSCGQEVEVLCKQPCAICSQQTLNSKTTTEKLVVNTTISIEQCIDFCPRSEKLDYVCGTNNVTYDNYEHLQCAQLCGEHVYILCEQKCNVCNLSGQNLTSASTINSTTSSETISRQTPTSNSIRTTNSTVKPPVKTTTNASSETAPNATVETPSNIAEEVPISKEYVEECMAQSCPTVSEYDPVCGSNNVTYRSPTHIVCAQTCGEIVIGLWFGPCYYDIDSSPKPPAPDSTPSTETSSNTVNIGDDVWSKIFETTSRPIQYNEFGFDPR